jgi:hypothetical protein
MHDKSPEANRRLDDFRRNVAIRERELEAAAHYPRSSTNSIRYEKRRRAREAPVIEWPSPSVMPDERELHDFMDRRLAKECGDLLLPHGSARPAQKDPTTGSRQAKSESSNKTMTAEQAKAIKGL